MEVKEQNSFTTTYNEQNLEKILHFGAIISISPSGEDFGDCFMSSDGFILKNIVLKKFKIGLDDFSENLFRIVPPYLFDVQKVMMHVVQNEEQSS